MIQKSDIDSIIFSAVKEIIKDYKSVNKETIFIGLDSNIDSVDIVQIISYVEDQLENNGFEGYDIFEKTFEQDVLSFGDFSDLIEQYLNL